MSLDALQQVSGGSLLDEMQFDGGLKPLTMSGERTQEQKEKAARVQACFNEMSEEDVAVLSDYLLAQRPLREMAREAGVSRQAMHRRLQKAKRAFVERWLGLPKKEEEMDENEEETPFDERGNLLPGWEFDDDGAVVRIEEPGAAS